MTRIALCGGPGTGKTTCAAAFTAHMNSLHRPFYHITEYARTFIDTYGADAIPNCGPLIQLKFLDKQLQREDEIPDSIEGFITDSPVFMAWFYAALYGDNSIASYIARKDNYKTFLKGIYRYDHIFIIKRESKYVDDGCRYQDKDEATLLDSSMENMLKLHRIPYHTISGTTPERVDQIFEAVYGEVRKVLDLQV